MRSQRRRQAPQAGSTPFKAEVPATHCIFRTELSIVSDAGSWAGKIRLQEVPMAFAIKAGIHDPRASTFVFTAQKTMYGGKHVAEGDTIFVFASENEGGQGLIARGVVASAAAVAKKRGVIRQTPRVSITIKRIALAKRPLGRNELKAFTDWKDGRPETELNFKFYRQATNKVIGISDEAAEFLRKFF
jgi:hypothetical protein